jgi:signal transduction histidine kinase
VPYPAHMSAGSAVAKSAVSMWRLAWDAVWAVSCVSTVAVAWPPGRRLAGPVELVMRVLAAFGLLIGAVVQMRAWGVPTGLVAVLAVVQVAPLVWAGRAPLAAWRLMALGLAVSTLLGYGQERLGWPWPAGSCAAFVLVLFAVAAGCARRLAVTVGVLTGVGVVLPALMTAHLPPGVALLVLGGVGGVVALGDSVRARRGAQEELRRELARRAVQEERSRIARELHDVVAHHMSMVAVQAEAAPHRIADLPEPARATFGVIRGAAREALAELRRLVGVLRDEAEPAERLPQPGLDRVAELVEGARRAGVPAELRVVGSPRPLSAGVDLSAYRIVQEGLSNAGRHAPGAPTAVELCYGSGALHVRVANDRPPSTRRHGAFEDSGHGLAGMRERVAMLGGVLQVGPRPDGGFEVEATLPTGDQERP